MISNDLGINGGLENSTGILQFSSKLRSIDQVTVMGQSQSTLYIIQYQRLCILSGCLLYTSDAADVA
mgnify:CR=1 FL=1